MRFAKVFDVAGTQLLCVLQPREEDGVPELKMITYVGNACVTFGNEVDDEGADPDTVIELARKAFDRFDQQQAEEAYRLAQRVAAQANEERTRPAAGDTDTDFGVPVQSTALH